MPQKAKKFRLSGPKRLPRPEYAVQMETEPVCSSEMKRPKFYAEQRLELYARMAWCDDYVPWFLTVEAIRD